MSLFRERVERKEKGIYILLEEFLDILFYSMYMENFKYDLYFGNKVLGRVEEREFELRNGII